MKKQCSLLLAAGMSAAILLTGCQKAEAQPEQAVQNGGFAPSMDTAAQLELTVYGSWSNFEALEAVALDWNEIYPNVTISYSKIDDYNKQLDAIVTAAEKPDMVLFGTTDYYANKDAIADALVDLSDVGLDTSAYQDGVLASTMYNGKMVVVNWGMQTTGFIVNEDLLAKCGLSVPSTHEEFLDVCSKLKAEGYVPLQGCYLNTYTCMLKNDRNARMAKEADQDALYQRFEAAEPGCGAYFDPEFETMFELLENGYIDPDLDMSIEDIYEYSILHFFEGNTPFFSSTAETVSGMKKRESKSEAFTNNPFSYSFVSLPVEADTPVLSISTLQGLAAVSGAQNEEWAKEFLRFMCSADELNKMAETKGVPALTKNSSQDHRFAFLQETALENRINSNEYPVLQLIDGAFNDTLWHIATGDLTTVQDAEKDFEERVASYNAAQNS